MKVVLYKDGYYFLSDAYELGSVLNTNKGFSHLVLIKPCEIDTHFPHVT